MSYVTTKDGIQINYKDWGNGQPIAFSHGWPLSANDWDSQIADESGVVLPELSERGPNFHDLAGVEG